MNNDISNKKLAGLLAIAIVVSIAGTFFSIDKISNIASRSTGYATQDTGTASIDITNELSLIVDVDNIDWGTGIVNSSLGGDCLVGANLTTGTVADATAAAYNDCWTGDTEATDFEVRSLSNVAMYPNIKASAVASGFIGGTSPAFQWAASDNVNGCTTYPATWTSFTTSDVDICATGNLATIGDSVYVAIRLFVPTDAVGTKSATVTFTASAT